MNDATQPGRPGVPYVARGARTGRSCADQIAPFESVGFALEDLAAAEAAIRAADARC